jgi:hypothetical protein
MPTIMPRSESSLSDVPDPGATGINTAPIRAPLCAIGAGVLEARTNFVKEARDSSIEGTQPKIWSQPPESEIS